MAHGKIFDFTLIKGLPKMKIFLANKYVFVDIMICKLTFWVKNTTSTLYKICNKKTNFKL